jgi:hypothetical protein
MMALLVACSALPLTLGGCGSDGASESQSGATDTNDAATGDESSGESSNDAGDVEYSQLTPETFQQVKDMWTFQLEGPIASAETLRKLEAEHNDQQLKDLIGQIDAKVAAARTMLDEATVANGSKTLQVDLPQVVGEANELVGRANLRLQEVLQAKFGGGSGEGGG